MKPRRATFFALAVLMCGIAVAQEVIPLTVISGYSPNALRVETFLTDFIPAKATAFADEHELSMAELTAWLDAYGAAWENRDADAAAALFSEDSSCQVTPYEEPHLGPGGVHAYWSGVTENQRGVQFEHQPLSVTGNTGIAHWSAAFKAGPDGTPLQLDGIFVLEFDADGKCRKLREWWHLRAPESGDAN